VSDPQPPYHGTVDQNGCDHRGVNPVLHPRFESPGLTKCTLMVLESPVGLIYHIFQLCLPCQSLVQSESKLFDLGSQLQFMPRESWFL
jgi:hypothetical protein